MSNKEAENELLGDHVTIQNEIDISNGEQSVDTNIGQKGSPTNTNSNGKENIIVPSQADESEISVLESGNLKGSMLQTGNKSADHANDDLCYGTGDSSSEERLDSTDEVDFSVSTLISAFASDNIIHKLCWLLKFYKSNSTSTNHYIICMLRRITDDLELSPMLYQVKICNVLTFQKVGKTTGCPTYQKTNNLASFKLKFPFSQNITMRTSIFSQRYSKLFMNIYISCTIFLNIFAVINPHHFP